MKDVKVVKEVKAASRLGVAAIAIVVSALAACGGNKPAEAPAAATPAATPAVMLSAAAQPKPSATVEPVRTVTPVAFEELVGLLPEVSGWTRSTPRGEQVRLDSFVSRAEAQYESDESLVRLDVTDSAFSPLVLAPISTMLVPTYSERSSGGYRKAVSVDASPGFETWRSNDRDAEVSVLIAGRFLVTGRGHNVESPDVVRAIVEAVDLRKLAGLK